MRKKETILERSPKDIVELWKIQFPGVPHADMVRMSWSTSLLNLDSKLRQGWNIPTGRMKYAKKKE